MSYFLRFVTTALVTLSTAGIAFAQNSSSPPLPKGLTPQETRISTEWNIEQQKTEVFQRNLRLNKPHRPTTDTDHFRYVLMNEDFNFDSKEIKQAIAENLPPQMKLIILVYPGYEEGTLRRFSRWISEDRIIIATHKDAAVGFWSRDSFPFPVYANSNLQVNLVAAKYAREFKAHEAIASAAGAKNFLVKKDFYYVGGNLLADENGRCFIVEGPRSFGVSDSTMMQSYGCTEVIRLPHVAGIGDVDEVIKILPNRKVLTNQKSYVSRLQSLGFAVTMLPNLGDYRTYANSLILGQTVIMPIFKKEEDQEAQRIYESFGYRVVPADSRVMSNSGKGSIHCATMAYPQIDLNDLMRHLNAKIYQKPTQ